MITNHFDVQGLSDLEVIESRKKFGQNRLNYKKTNTILEAIKNLVREPMILLLLVAASIYFISGKISDGIFMASAIVLVAMISLYQDSRSRNALEKLKQFTQNKCNVIRNGNKIEISTENLVIGDLLMAEEGSSISADGTIIQSNDFSVNESILTGESYAVFKDQKSIDNQIFLGTTVSSGLAIATITAIGNETKLGKIGKSLENIDEQATPLEIQISQFVKKMVYAGALVFVLVWGINYYHTHLILSSLIKALTLAMSILPEEIPVAFTTFMALGGTSVDTRPGMVARISHPKRTSSRSITSSMGRSFHWATVDCSKGAYSGFCTALRISDGLVVASWGWNCASCLKSPVSATTVVNCLRASS